VYTLRDESDHGVKLPTI